jgi:threonine/homoserine/homoserine lactone efflux protein
VSSTLALYLLATLLICLSPGPNVLLMISFGLRDGFRGVLPAVGGVVCASLLYLSISALGVVAALHASATLFAVVRYAGAAYLAYLGVRLLSAAWRARAVPDAGAARDGPAVVRGSPAPPRAAYWQGFATHISNPKAIVFWTALLPQFVDAARPLGPQVVALGLLGIAIDAVVLSGYGLFAAITRRFAPAERFGRWIDAAAGAFFVVTAALLAFAHLE